MLRDLAEVFLATPALVANIAMIYIMGGALAMEGNVRQTKTRIDNPYAEWNTFIDPYAAEVVFHSGAPITLVPLDATNQVPVTPEYCARLDPQADTPAPCFVAKALSRAFVASP